MECGSKMVEGGPTELPMSSGSRPRDTGHLWNSQIGFQEDRSLLRSPHRDFAAMLRAETIKTCLPDRDPYDLQRAVNVYHSFRNETYKFIAKKHGVVSLRFEHVEPIKPKRAPRTHVRSEYKRNSLCAIFEYCNPKFDFVKRRRQERLNNLIL